MEIRKREGKEVWVPVDHGTIYLTDQQAIFTGSKTVKFRYDKLIDQQLTNNGLYLSVSNRKKPHMLSGPAEKVSALITASEAVGRGEEATAQFGAKAESLRYTVDEIERDLDSLRAERAALVAPPRPISPAWIPLSALFLLLFVSGALADTPAPQSVAAATTTTTSALSTTTTNPTTTTIEVTTTETTTSSQASTTSNTTTRPVDHLVLDFLLAISIELETQSGYDRDLFSVWSDEDGDGCDTRAEVLIRDAVETPEIGSGCDVGGGLWYSIYDGVWLDHADQLNVDHVVALKEAWDSGARGWDAALRVAFGNDLASPLTLIAVSSSSNQNKGDADPSNWLPPNKDDVCRYIAAWTVIKAEWGLSMDESEHGRIRTLLQGPCEGTTVSDALAAYPSPPTPTTTTEATTAVAGTTEVVIANIRYDAPGNDVEYNDSEYVLLRNDGTGTADVGGWSLTDEADHRIMIPSGYVIQPEGEFRVYTGPGDDTADRYFAGGGQAIWNNSGGDTATLRDSSGETVDTYSYSS